MRSPPRPIVLLPACERWIDGRPLQSVRQQYLDALHAVGLQALVVPTSTPPDWDRLLPLADGLLLTGSPSNIEPGHYGAALQTPELPLDPARDAAVLPLVPRVLALGLPLLAICRGFQEANVALGGSLYQDIGTQVPETLNLPASTGLIPSLVHSDEFSRKKGEPALPLVWQWNHNPENKLVPPLPYSTVACCHPRLHHRPSKSSDSLLNLGLRSVLAESLHPSYGRHRDTPSSLRECLMPSVFPRSQNIHWYR